MKVQLSLLSVAFLLFSCGDSNPETENSSPQVQQETNESDSPVQTTAIKNMQAFADNLVEYQSCKAENKKRGSCKEYTAKAICEAYGIQDFKEGDNYIDYDKIPTKISELSNWEKVGDVSTDNLVEALMIVNDYKRPVVVFNTNEKYVQVVVLEENGTSTISNKWGGLKVPTCISYFPTRPAASFTNKGLNYAFKSADGLEIWARKN